MSVISYVDDLTITNDANLWRRIASDQYIYDDNRRINRPSSQAFRDHRNGTPMSIAIEDVFFQTQREPIDYIIGHKNVVALASFKAALARELNQKIVRDPLPKEPSHALVVGKKTDRVRRRFACESAWVIPPTKIDTINEVV